MDLRPVLTVELTWDAQEYVSNHPTKPSIRRYAEQHTASRQGIIGGYIMPEVLHKYFTQQVIKFYAPLQDEDGFIQN